MTGADESRSRTALQLLEQRCAELPATLRAVLAELEPRADLRFAARPPPGVRRFLTTGIGASEGPARFLAHLLAVELGLPARFVPLSVFASAQLPEVLGAAARDLGETALLSFSQGLSPNAQLLFAHAGRFAKVLLWTSAAPTARLAALGPGLELAVLPPASEDRVFLRVLGPAAAKLAAAQFALSLADGLGLPRPDWQLDRVPAVVATAAARARAAQRRLLDEISATAASGWDGSLSRQPVALIASGGYGECCHGLRWKLLEGLGLADPPVWDALLVAHGPLQQIYRQPHLLIALARNALDGALLDRLQQVLVPGRHTLLQLRAELPGSLALLDHDAQLDALLLDALRRGETDWDGLRWPGRGADAALYGLAEPLPAEPDGRPAEPDGRPAEPDGRPAEPDGRSLESE